VVKDPIAQRLSYDAKNKARIKARQAKRLGVTNTSNNKLHEIPAGLRGVGLARAGAGASAGATTDWPSVDDGFQDNGEDVAAIAVDGDRDGDAVSDTLLSDGESDSGEQPLPSYTDCVVQAYLQDFAKAADSRAEVLAAGAAALRSQAEAHGKCPNCDTAGSHAPCPVTIVTVDQPVLAAVPVSWCKSCSQPYHPRPTQLDCLPDSTPGWDLSSHRTGQSVLWWQQPVLQLFDMLVYRTRCTSADAFCQALMDNWERNGFACPDSVSGSTLRQRLRQAFRLYMSTQGAVEDYPEGAISGWPRGALNACPCCGDSVTCCARNEQQLSPAGGGETGGEPASQSIQLGLSCLQIPFYPSTLPCTLSPSPPSRRPSCTSSG
jgi:hypothetical protein